MTQKEFRLALIVELADQGAYQHPTPTHPSTSSYTPPPHPTGSHKQHYFSEGQNVAKQDVGSAGRQACKLCHKKIPVDCFSCNVPLCFVATGDHFNAWHT